MEMFLKSKRKFWATLRRRAQNLVNPWIWVFALSIAIGNIYAALPNAPERPVVPYWHVYTDDKGVSHQKRCEVTAFDWWSISPGAAPSWIDKLGIKSSNVLILVLPVGWVGEWHENPKPQWIIPLSGRWFVETMDGKRVEMGTGEISFGNDQNTKADSQGRRGHRSGAVGNEPAVLMLVQLESFSGGPACPFK